MAAAMAAGNATQTTPVQIIDVGVFTKPGLWPMLASACFPPCFLTVHSNAGKCIILFSALFPYCLLQ